MFCITANSQTWHVQLLYYMSAWRQFAALIIFNFDASLAEISSQHHCIPISVFCVLLRLGFELRLVKSGRAVSFSETEKVYLIIIGFRLGFGLVLSVSWSTVTFFESLKVYLTGIVIERGYERQRLTSRIRGSTDCVQNKNWSKCLQVLQLDDWPGAWEASSDSSPNQLLHLFICHVCFRKDQR